MPSPKAPKRRVLGEFKPIGVLVRASERERLLWLTDAQLLSECECDRWRASGPGGQKRNKTESAIRLRHLSSGLAVICSESRSQATNRRKAIKRLREQAAMQLREPIDETEYRIGGHLADLIASGSFRGPVRQQQTQYLCAVSELLDVFVACHCSLGPTAKMIGLSTSKLSRMLRSDERVVRQIGELRRVAGLKPLRWQ